MNLLNCPDCASPVSRRAAACPSCGCPLAAIDAAPRVVVKNDVRATTQSTSKPLKFWRMVFMLTLILSVVCAMSGIPEIVAVAVLAGAGSVVGLVMVRILRWWGHA